MFQDVTQDGIGLHIVVVVLAQGVKTVFANDVVPDFVGQPFVNLGGVSDGERGALRAIVEEGESGEHFPVAAVGEHHYRSLGLRRKPAEFVGILHFDYP